MKKKALLFSLTVLLMAGVIFAQEGRGGGRLMGEVVDESGKALEGAKIKLAYVEYKYKAETVSNDKGQWGFIGIGKGTVIVTAEKEGFVMGQIQLGVSGANKNPTQKIVLQKPQSAAADPASAFFVKGSDLYDQGKYEEAKEAFTQFLAENPTASRVRVNIGNCLLNLGKYDEAIAEFEKLAAELEAKPVDPETTTLKAQVYASIADTYMRQDKFEQAMEFFKKALACNPGDPAIPFNIGEIMLNAGNGTEAVKYYNIAIQIKPQWAKAYMKLGYAYLNQGDTASAVTNLKKFLELAPDDPEAGAVQGVIKSLTKK